MFENIVRVSTAAHAKRGLGKYKYAVYRPWLRPNAVGSGKTRRAAQSKKDIRAGGRLSLIRNIFWKPFLLLGSTIYQLPHW